MILNEIKQHIGRVIAACTAERRGRFSRMLIDRLDPDDTIINFNYDLLLDAEFLGRNDKLQYYNFSQILLNTPILDRPILAGRHISEGNGLYLKMHGSLNWYSCSNQFCPKFQQLEIFPNVEHNTTPIAGTDFCLYSYISPGIRRFSTCEGCQTTMGPVIIPPLLNKQILTTPVFRCVWGNASNELKAASAVVVIGYSFPKTDFYSDWLFRNIRLDDDDTQVVIVNPVNDPNNSDHDDFSKRMHGIFRGNYIDRFTKFEELEEVLDSI